MDKSAHAGKYHEGIVQLWIAEFFVSNYQSTFHDEFQPMQSVF